MYVDTRTLIEMGPVMATIIRCVTAPSMRRCLAAASRTTEVLARIRLRAGNDSGVVGAHWARAPAAADRPLIAKANSPRWIRKGVVPVQGPSRADRDEHDRDPYPSGAR
jgi:hypothetical protein